MNFSKLFLYFIFLSLLINGCNSPVPTSPTCLSNIKAHALSLGIVLDDQLKIKNPQNISSITRPYTIANSQKIRSELHISYFSCMKRSYYLHFIHELYSYVPYHVSLNPIVKTIENIEQQIEDINVNFIDFVINIKTIFLNSPNKSISAFYKVLEKKAWEKTTTCSNHRYDLSDLDEIDFFYKNLSTFDYYEIFYQKLLPQIEYSFGRDFISLFKIIFDKDKKVIGYIYRDSNLIQYFFHFDNRCTYQKVFIDHLPFKTNDETGEKAWRSDSIELSRAACNFYSKSLSDHCKKTNSNFKEQKTITLEDQDSCNLRNPELNELLAKKLCPQYGWPFISP